jgi:hypothetical protein
MDYKRQYVKYKKKYLNLKDTKNKMRGGGYDTINEYGIRQFIDDHFNGAGWDLDGDRAVRYSVDFFDHRDIKKNKYDRYYHVMKMAIPTTNIQLIVQVHNELNGENFRTKDEVHNSDYENMLLHIAINTKNIEVVNCMLDTIGFKIGGRSFNKKNAAGLIEQAFYTNNVHIIAKVFNNAYEHSKTSSSTDSPISDNIKNNLRMYENGADIMRDIMNDKL